MKRILGALALLTLTVGCRDASRIVADVDCIAGETRDCPNPVGCGVGTERCSAEGTWEKCTDIDYARAPHPECYTGPAGTEWVGICHGGREICENGKTVCAFGQTPLPRNCNNGADNDCNGHVDALEFADPHPEVDVVLFLDESSSMSFVFSTLQEAITEFTQLNPSDGRMRIAVVGMPHGVDGTCGLITDFKLPSEIPALIQGMDVNSSPYNLEPTLDCAYLAADAAAAQGLGLTYRAGVRKTFISFTDERAQSYLTVPVTAQQVGARLAATRTVYYSFDSAAYRPMFQPIVDATGGKSFEINRGTRELLEDMLGLFSRLTCGG